MKILSSDWLLPGESEKELNQLRSDMIISYFPDGSAELHRVEMIVWDEWRLKSVPAASPQRRSLAFITKRSDRLPGLFS